MLVRVNVVLVAVVELELSEASWVTLVANASGYQNLINTMNIKSSSRRINIPTLSGGRRVQLVAEAHYGPLRFGLYHDPLAWRWIELVTKTQVVEAPSADMANDLLNAFGKSTTLDAFHALIV